MSEQAPIVDSQDAYIQQHPNAVEDMNTARFMAEGMDPHETKAVELRKELAETALQAAANTDSYHHGKPLVEMGVQARRGTLVNGIKDQQELSNRKGSDLKNIYEAIEGTKR